MSHNFTKRIENRIRKISNKMVKGGYQYILTTVKVFVPNKGSKLMFRQTDVNPVKCIVTLYGTPPALRDLPKIYEEAMGAYYLALKPYKKMKRRLNKYYRKAV